MQNPSSSFATSLLALGQVRATCQAFSFLSVLITWALLPVLISGRQDLEASRADFQYILYCCFLSTGKVRNALNLP